MARTVIAGGRPGDSARRWRRDLLTGGFGVFLIGGVFTDGWAHFNRPGLESFFTPWHAVLYSSLGVMTAWLASVAWRASEGAPRTIARTLPQGYGLALVGAVIFGLGGIADLLWHEAFGIEVAVDTLLSPTHLLLGVGGVLILSTGMRAQGVLRPRAPVRWRAPALLSLALTLAMVVFFLLYTSPFPLPGPLETFTPTPEGTPGHEEAELPVVAALASYLLSTVMITLALLLTQRAGRPSRGAAALIVATVAFLPVVVVGLPGVASAGAVGAVVGAAAFELVSLGATRLANLDAASWLLPGLLAFLVWTGQLAGLATADALRWPTSLWAGLILISTLVASAVAFVSSAPARTSSVMLSDSRPGQAR